MEVIRKLSERRDLRLGILGGTFDPVHMGHLVAAEEVRKQLDLTDVVFIPTGEAPHKDRRATAAEVRYLMAGLATAPHSSLWISRVEIDREGVDYTVDTLDTLRRVLGPSVPLFFVAGIDSVLDFLSWKEPDRLLELCMLVAVSRPGCEANDLGQVLSRLRQPDRVHLLEIPEFGISSSMIRRRVREGLGCRFLVPHEVEKVIEKMDLYRENE